MRKSKIFKLVSLVLCLSFILAACGQGGTDTKEQPPTNEETGAKETQYKDTITVAMTAQPPTLDASLTQSQVTFGVAGNIFEQLYTMNAEYIPTPELAESVEISEDKLEYVFTLRQGVKFHNGKEMKADDVVTSMNRWLNVNGRAKALLEGANFEKIDDYTVKLKVTRATSDVLIILSTRSLFPTIMPKEVIEAASPEGVKEYIGTGPYKLQEWKQDQYIHLVKFDDYSPVDSEPSGFSGKKEAPTENIYFYFVTDHATRIAGIKTGEYDVAENIPLENYEELSTEEGVTLYSKPSGSLNAFFNTTEGLLADVKIRQAILAAIDANEVMLVSYASPEHFTLDPGYMNINQPQWAVKAGAEYYNQANPEKAKQLLEEAGYNGETVTLLTTKDYQEMYAATIAIQEQLRQVGINAEVSNSDFPTFMETKKDRSKWDIFITSNGYNVIPPQILAVNPDWAGFSAPEVKTYLDAIRGASSDEEAQKQWANLQQFMYEYGSSTALGHYNSSMATTDKVEGFVFFDQPIYWNAKVAQ
ncbi:ABC transporter substrate-binding protein [Tissierella creatinini]|nr:ABC transporter substrate-binding protein [Tissierella creatinini]TJX64156.1 ABC transporter substrate-binding protein [Soehngenia saccharolytica]